MAVAPAGVTVILILRFVIDKTSYHNSILLHGCIIYGKLDHGSQGLGIQVLLSSSTLLILTAARFLQSGGDAMPFTYAQEMQHLRNRCVASEKRNKELEGLVARLLTDQGLEEYKEKLRKESEDQLMAAEKKAETAMSQAERLKQKNEQQQEDFTRKLDLQGQKLARKIEKLQENCAKLESQVQQSDSDRAAALERATTAETTSKANAARAEKLEQANAALTQQLANASKEHAEDARKITVLENEVSKLGGEVGRLNVKVSKDSRNSSKPTSQCPYQPRVRVNNRMPSEKPQGAQPGHQHHPRVKAEIPGSLSIAFPEETSSLWADPDYEFTGFTTKTIVTPVFSVHHEDVAVAQFRHRKTGAHKSAGLPADMKDELIYSAHAKAVCLYLNQYTGIAVDKLHDALDTMSMGAFAPSEGFINDLTVEFAEKSTAEWSHVFDGLFNSRFMHVDGTTLRILGKRYNITMCCSGPYRMFFLTARKGKAGVKGTPIEATAAILCHDHDVVYLLYGSLHQECLEHIKRYLLACLELEKNRTWAMKMLEFIRKREKEAKEFDEAEAAAAESNGDADDTEGAEDDDPFIFEFSDGEVAGRVSKEKADEYEAEMKKIAADGLAEYEQNPAPAWFRDGYNTCKRMFEHPEDYLLFLRDKRVYWNNNPVEQLGRTLKRRQAACMQFRGFLHVIAYLHTLGIIESLKKLGKPVLLSMEEIFAREVCTSDKLNLRKQELGVLNTVIEMDIFSVEKSQNGLEKAETELKDAEAQYNVKKTELETAKTAADEQFGTEREPTDKEKTLQTEAVAAEYAVGMAEISVYQKKRQLEFNQRHLAHVQKCHERSEKQIAQLEAKLQQEVSMEYAPPLPPPRTVTADPEKVAGAQEKVDAAKEVIRGIYVRLNDCCAACTINTAGSVLSSIGRDKTESRKSIFMKDFPVPEKMTEASEMRSLKQELADALNLLTAATKELDAARKGYVKRKYKPRKSSKDAEQPIAASA